MTRTNVEATHRKLKKTSQRAPKRALPSAKKPRSARSSKGGTPAARSAPAKKGAASAGDDDPALRAEGAAAFARVRADMEALPADQVRRINVYVPAAVLVALGARPRLLGLRDQMRALAGHPPDTLDKLRDYALATAYAYVRALPRDVDETQLRALLSEATPLRGRLLRSAELLVDFGLVDATRVAIIRRGTGHVDTALDLSALGTLFRDAWPAVAAKTPVTPAEVDRAEALGLLLLEALGQRQQGSDGTGAPREAQEQLAKVYELFFRTYDECRRAVLYLRWHQGDADAFAPSLQQGRRRGRAAPSDEPAGDDPEGDEPAGDEPPGDVPDGRGTE